MRPCHSPTDPGNATRGRRQGPISERTVSVGRLELTTSPYNRSPRRCDPTGPRSIRARRVSRGFAESGFVIRHEFLDDFSRQLMLNVELLPRLLQVQLLVGSFRADRLVRKVVTWQWHSFFCPLLQNLGRNGYKLRVDVKRVKQMLKVADTGSQYEDVMVALIEHAFDISD